MAKFTPARGRVDLFVAFALFGLVAYQEAAAIPGDQRHSPFTVLSRKVAASKAKPVSHAHDGFTVLAAKVAASKAEPGGRRLTAAATAGAVRNHAALATLGIDDGTTFTAAHGIPEWEPPPPAPTPLVVPTSPSQWFNPRGQHEGTEGIVWDLAKLGVTDNGRLYVNECWGRTWGAATSDHHSSQRRSWACDLSVPGVQVPTPEAQLAAERIGSALGEPGWTGGNLRKTINGYRVQVLWKVAGHFNHVHVGVRKA